MTDVTERDIDKKMIATLCNMISAEGAYVASQKWNYAGYSPGQIEKLVREIAERELREK